MSRTYLQAIGLTGAGLITLAVLPGSIAARALFDTKPLDQSRFAVLAQPVGDHNWKLLVLEQIKRRPLCWTPRPDGLIDPSLNNFDFSGICSRYLDSNGYSLRSGGRDLSRRFSLRLVQSGNTLHLQAMDPDQAMPIRIGSATVPRRDRNGFVKLTLNDAWTLERRVYQGRTLSHVYFSHPEPVNRLLAKSEPSSSSPGFSRIGSPTAPQRPGRTTPQSNQEARPTNVARVGKGPIRLEVIPYRR